MKQHKIIFTGPVGAGKTTAIQAISDVPLIKTEVLASDLTKTKKPTTTVAMDYGVMKLTNGKKIHLFGTPGQERFDFMWEILINGGSGLVLLLDNSKPDPFKDMWFFLESFKGFITKTQVAIGITQVDVKNQPTVADYQEQLKTYPIKPPVFSIDARLKSDVTLLVQSLLYSQDP